MSTDRELLEAAAKAAGFSVIKWQDMRGWGEVRYGLSEAIWNGQAFWNGLADDGDAFRLAVTLNIGVQCHVYSGTGYALAQCGQGDNEAHAVNIEPGDDPAAATRRAIVRAAAAMART